MARKESRAERRTEVTGRCPVVAIDYLRESFLALGLSLSLLVGLYLASRIGWRARSFRPSELVAKDLKVVVSR
jgi:hypothetical protein